MNKVLLYITFLSFAFIGFAQDTDEQLANYYYNQGDCKKALPYLEIVHNRKPSELSYTKYIGCLRETEDDKQILKVIRQQAKDFPNTPKYGVDLGEEYYRQGDARRGERTFQELIDDLKPSPSLIINLQRAFSNIGKNDWALKVLKKGDQLMNGRYPFNLQYADIYGSMNQVDLMIKEYVNVLDHTPSMISSLKIILPRTIDFDEDENPRFDLLRTELVKKIQKNPQETIFSELLIWALTQRKNFPAALIQAKGLDKRKANDGREVYTIGNQALRNNDFSTARNAFKYILELEHNTPYRLVSQQLLLTSRYKEITSKRNYSQEQIEETINEYKESISKMPENGKMIPVMRELAYIQAYYGNQPLEGVKTLDKALALPRYNDLEEAKTKMLQADIRVLLNDIWEASLQYMQIEKKFKYEPIGEEAKFKNARIFYYDGDFKFAQSQLDILKEATTRLIANDAMNLSILITDNLGMDSNYVAMRRFAEADLLLEQHRYEEAFQLFDSINNQYPTHNLTDDILMRRAQAAQERGLWEEAINYLEKIVEDHGEDILADDALYQLAKIHQDHLFDNKKAAEYYFKLMRDYPGSLFVTEARKAYREIN